ncbi:VCBS repeat-containing protein [Pseudoalteromonas luteoviolacea]|uniref:FG-GAP repeat domain-containing protein n=1 Tax=Pseudoalteromonas luteoviolacea TaxID=43657 RepID=UPI001B388865|nr:VCBS repeat-containing protein [Pseudoalteromonas luteoviolacea]MBQ4810582.1 VCBS repeat-containing protein [Pseudoalteromonas luteoviolacea]
MNKHYIAQSIMAALLISPLFSANSTETDSVHNGYVPWKYKELNATQYGTWSYAEKVYTTDINGDGNADIVRLNPESTEHAIKVFLSKATVQHRGRVGATPLSTDESIYKGSYVDFVRPAWANEAKSGLHIFNGEHVSLYVGNFDYAPGKDLLRQERSESWGHDEFLSANIHSGFTTDGNSMHFSRGQELSDLYNGYKGNNVYIGDFNGDGLDDVLRTESGDLAEDIGLNVTVAYNHRGQIGTMKNLTMSSDSDNTEDRPGRLFPNDKSFVRIADFNGDGLSDILRWNKNETIEGVDENSDTEPQIDIWFGQPNTEGKFKRSKIYIDANDDHLKTRSDDELKDKMQDVEFFNLRTGDFNGDGNDDIVYFSGYSYTVLLSRAVHTKKQQNQSQIVRENIALFSKTQLEVAGKTVFDNKQVGIGDFNNDNRDDIVIWNGVPFILYSTQPQQQEQDAELKKIEFVGVHHKKTMNLSGQITNHFSGHANTYKTMRVADFSGDGYPDLLMIPESGESAYVYITPPYNPLTNVQFDENNSVSISQDVNFKQQNFVFYNDGNQIKYIVRGDAGWKKAKTLPLYRKRHDPRCQNDLPSGARFLTAADFPNPSSGTNLHVKPICNAAYTGEKFDVTTDGNYLYLFREYQNNVIVERFTYSDVASEVQRLVESRYKAAQKRFDRSVQVINDPSQNQRFATSDIIDTSDAFGDLFYEPAFEVPFAIHNGQSCELGSITATTSSTGQNSQRILLATSCKNSSLIRISSVKKGEDKLFDSSDFDYINEQGEKQSFSWYQQVQASVRGAVQALDAITINATVTNEDTQKRVVLDEELVVAATTKASGQIRTSTLHYPMTKSGGFRSTSDSVRPAYKLQPFEVVGFNSAPRMTYASDGLVHMYWRGSHLSHNDRSNILMESVLDPSLYQRFGKLKMSWGAQNRTTEQRLTLDNRWVMDWHSNSPRTWSNNNVYIYTPKFGTYYHGEDKPLEGFSTAPIVFENGRLVDQNGEKAGILYREFLELHQTYDGKHQFVASDIALYRLTAEYDKRITADASLIGFIEGAPPVPKENLGRDQNGKWGYSDATSASINIENGVTYSLDLDQSAGANVSGRLTLGGKSPFVSQKIDITAELRAGAIFGGDKEYSLSDSLQRASILTGTPPSEACNGDSNPWTNNCIKTDDDGNVTELWQPHNEGALFVSALSADRYALYNPRNNKLIGYALDFSRAIEDEAPIKFKINPAYQLAGSLDGYIGDYKVSTGQSYFNPGQEVAWLIKYKRQSEELLKRYGQSEFKANNESAEGFALDKLLTAKVSVTDGSFLSTDSTAASSITDYFGYDLEFNAGVSWDVEIELTGAGWGASAGGYYARTYKHTKGNNSEINFSIDIDNTIASEVQDGDNNTLPGAVDAYTVRSYFLPASVDNYYDLIDIVVDPSMLGREDAVHSSDVRALRILKQIQDKAKNTGNPAKIWRVVHRVDGVSRPIHNPMGR